jgi:tetratricopeptide (TPR) repeat protein
MKCFSHAVAVLLLAVSVAHGQTNLLMAPDSGSITNANVLVGPENGTNKTEAERFFQGQMDIATQQRHDKNPGLAIPILISLLKTNAPPEFQRKALFELALATQDNGEFVKAQQIFAQFRQRYPEDPSVPEVLLREGLLYRQMGVNTLAISKFYAVMSTALKLRLDNVDYYKSLVLQAQTEIADTYYLQGQFDQAADYFTRILKADTPGLNRGPIEFKLIRSLAYMTNYTENVVRAEHFLEKHPDSGDVPEVRFDLATAYKGVGRNQDAMKQVLLLLRSQQESVSGNAEVWVYWQRRAGNEIANELYRDGDYMDSLQIYESLAELDRSVAWRAPVWYQIGLVYEQLQQWQKASNTYGEITALRKELTATNSPPSLASLCDMAQWRVDNIAWMQQAQLANHEFKPSPLRKPETNVTNEPASGNN